MPYNYEDDLDDAEASEPSHSSPSHAHNKSVARAEKQSKKDAD